MIITFDDLALLVGQLVECQHWKLGFSQTRTCRYEASILLNYKILTVSRRLSSSALL